MHSNSSWDTVLNLPQQFHADLPGLDDFPFSKYDFPRTIWWVRPTAEILVKSVTFAPVIFLGIFGNCAVIALIAVQPKMRTPVNILLTNMAATDLMTAAILPVLFMVEDFYQNWMLGSFMCKAEGFFMLLLTLASAFTLSTVSVLRLLMITTPNRVHLTPCGTGKICFIIWTCAAVLASPLVLWRHYRVRAWKNFTEIYCSEDIHVLGVYWLIVGCLLVWLPLFVILFTYAWIFLKLESTVRRVSHQAGSTHSAPAARRGRDHVARMLCTAAIVYFICWTPFAAVVIARYRLSGQAAAITPTFRALWYTSHYLMYANASVNPLVYSITNQVFREGLKQLLRVGVPPEASVPTAITHVMLQHAVVPPEERAELKELSSRPALEARSARVGNEGNFGRY